MEFYKFGAIIFFGLMIAVSANQSIHGFIEFNKTNKSIPFLWAISWFAFGIILAINFWKFIFI